jgi:hypothetical protein
MQSKSFNDIIKAQDFVNSFEDDDTIDITIKDYLKLNEITRSHLVLFKTDGINWEKKEVEMDPYLLGMWLGDGLSAGVGFALNYKTDFEILAYWEKWAENNGAILKKDKRYKYSIASKINMEAAENGFCNRVEEAPLKKYLRKYNLINNKHIPIDFIVNDKDTRLKVLAGLIDTDGNVRAEGREIRICQGPENYRIIDDAYYLATSLGFSCGVKEGRSQWTDEKSGEKKFGSYKELTITGSKIYEIPTLLPRKKLQKITDKTQLLRSQAFMGSLFQLKEVGMGNYVGWQLDDKRGRFLLYGGLSSHNTPEGASVGIVKNLSYMAHITTPSNSSGLYDYILPQITLIDDLFDNPELLYDKVKVFINGCWVGITENPMKLYNNLKDKKYKGIINIYTSIIFDYKLKEIKVRNDAGRLTRPLFKVKNKQLIYTNDIVNKLKNTDLEWNDVLYSGKIGESIIEYIDSYEQNNSMIAMEPELLTNSENDNYIYHYTHCEIHPSTIFGVLASCIPFPEHNQSPRNTYQCLDINTPVLMKDKSYKLIKDIKVGDEVQTFHPETMKMSYSKIINQYVRENKKQMYSLTTYSGKSVNATCDHKFMTYNGWKEVENLDLENDLIGIEPLQIEMEHKCDETIILDKEQFINQLSEFVKENTIYKYIDELEKLKLLPLYSTDRRIPILARMFGFVLADGTLTYHKRDKAFMLQADFGCEYGTELFELDIEDIGFNKTKHSEGTRIYKGSTYHTWAICYQNVIGSLFKALGMVSGKKTIQASNDVPDWIKYGSDLVKREFLSSIQGGDGCQIRYNKLYKKGYNYVCGSLMMSKNEEHKDSLTKFMETISELFNYFNIDNKIVCFKNKRDKDRYNIGVQISNSQNNLIKYFDTIGYRYDTRKITNSAIIIEYLKYKNIMNKEHVDKINYVRELHDKNYTNKYISNTTKLDMAKISDIIRSYKNNRNISCPNLKDNNIENFVRRCKVINGSIFVPIKSRNKITMNLISDITTESENHSFILNTGYLSSNSAMGKQSLGMYVTNFDNRMDKTAYVLSYPMRPLVDTRIMDLIRLNSIPSGEQVIVAIASHSGYNQEDSILFNKSSVDRGLFLATIYHTEKDEDKKLYGNEEIRCKPDKSKTKNMKFANYNKVNSQGVIPENTLVEDRDIIIAKVLPIKENKNDFTKTIKYSDESHVYRTHEETYIDKNYIDCNGDGYNFCKVRLRNYRKPVIGDKFSSRHGQKGTIGNIIPEKDMPFTADGLKPDIIINPHAIPSRMTIAQLKETLLGKVLIQLGLFGDGTSFSKFKVSDITKELQKLGYESNGNELMYNGLTGEQLHCSVFIGPAFYQRLKHMVNDKQHSRAIGPMVNLTRQPAEGRARDGGLRFGEMERDAMISHGASRFTKGRLYDASDAYSLHICNKCGLIASYNNKQSIHICNTCENRTDFKYVEIPYACKLMFQELHTMNIAPRIICE